LRLVHPIRTLRRNIHTLTRRSAKTFRSEERKRLLSGRQRYVMLKAFAISDRYATFV